MSDARDEILTRIRTALRDVPGAESAGDVTVERRYRTRGETEPVDLLDERLRDYHADVWRLGSEPVGKAVTRACAERGLARVAVPPSLPASWRPDGVELIEDHGLTALQLDEIDVAVTGCAVASAQTGTLWLDGRGACGRRLLTLVPDHHICIVRRDQIVDLVPEAIAALSDVVREHRAPVTLISGPSATSDIELSRVEGVHGPRRLLVLITDGG